MDFNRFLIQKPRPLPVIIIADTSGSMTESGKIAALNTALRDMLHAFREESGQHAEIHVAIISMGGPKASLPWLLQPAHELQYTDLTAAGHTPMGSAFRMLQRILEDPDLIPGRAYRPTLVLVSDGHPSYEDWEESLNHLLDSPRASKASRFALAVGEDADLDVLTRFAGAEQVRAAQDARQIRKFFRFVTMSVTARSRSATPNQSVTLPDLGEDDGFDDLE